MSRRQIAQRIGRLEQTLGCRMEVLTYAQREATSEQTCNFVRASAASRGFFQEGNESLAELFCAFAWNFVPGTEDSVEGSRIRSARSRSTMYFGPEQTMNRALERRIELLESRFEPNWEPLRVIVTSIRTDYEFGPGERIVEDEFLEGQDPRYPLVLTVHERTTTVATDRGKRWLDQL